MASVLTLIIIRVSTDAMPVGPILANSSVFIKLNIASQNCQLNLKAQTDKYDNSFAICALCSL